MDLRDRLIIDDGSEEAVCSCLRWWKHSPPRDRVLLFLIISVIIITAVVSIVIPSVIHRARNREMKDSTNKHHIAIAERILKNINTSVDPCDDFYQLACGNFMAENRSHLNESRNGYTFDPFYNLQRSIRQQFFELIIDDNRTNETLPMIKAKLRSYHSACSNREKLGQDGIHFLREMVDDSGHFVLDVKQLPSNWSLAKLLGKIHAKYNSNVLVNVAVQISQFNSSENVLYVSPSNGVSINESFANSTTSWLRNISALQNESESTFQFYKIMARLADVAIAQESENSNFISDVLRLEKDISNAINMSSINRADIRLDEIYSLCNVSWLIENVPIMNWSEYFRALLSQLKLPFTLINDATKVIVVQKEALLNVASELGNLQKMTPNGKATIHNYAIFQAMWTHYPTNVYDIIQAFYNDSSVNETKYPNQRNKWSPAEKVTPENYCMDETTSRRTSLNHLAAAVYVSANLEEINKKIIQVERLLKDIFTAYDDAIQSTEWLDPGTKSVALAKLAAMKYEIGYPVWLLQNESSLLSKFGNFDFHPDTYFENYQNLVMSVGRDAFASIVEETDKTQWFGAAHLVNAENVYSLNKIFIFAGIMDEPFLHMDSSVPDALNYGALGSIIGHEITHSFDAGGSQYDKYGNLKSWWLNTTAAAFKDREKCVIDRYSAIKVGRYTVPGNHTLSENMADTGGIHVAYRAYSASTQSSSPRSLPGLEQFNSDKLFFLAFAQLYCDLESPNALARRIQDVHSPDPARIIGALQDSYRFSKVFSCPSGSHMNPAKKCYLWQETTGE